MNIGQGIGVQGLSVFTGFPAGSADNGLSIDAGTGNIVLGDDTGGILSTLLSNREIPMNGFDITMIAGTFSTRFQNGGGITIAESISNLQTILSTGRADLVGNSLLGSSPSLNLTEIQSGGTNWQQSNEFGILEFAETLNTGRFLRLDSTAIQEYQIGDIDGTLNGTAFTIDDNNNNFIFDNTASNAGIMINGVAGFTGTVAGVTNITVNNGIVTAAS
jgi:hypothetical protein